MDLNTILQNFTIEAEKRSQSAASEAAEVRKGLGDTEDPMYNGMVETRARLFDLESARWNARATHARQGLVFVESTDISWQMEPRYRAMIDEAACAGRTVYGEVQRSADGHVILDLHTIA
jgi:hypothetical protein